MSQSTGYCGVVVARPFRGAFVRRERDRASVWLSRGFVGSPPSLSSPLGPLFLGLPQSSLSPTSEPSTSVVQVCCRTAISQSSRSSVLLSLCLSPSLCPPQQEPRIPVSAGPLSRNPASLSQRAPCRNPASLSQRAPSGLPESMTQLEQQWSSFAFTRLFGNNN